MEMVCATPSVGTGTNSGAHLHRQDRDTRGASGVHAPQMRNPRATVPSLAPQVVSAKWQQHTIAAPRSRDAAGKEFSGGIAPPQHHVDDHSSNVAPSRQAQLPQNALRHPGPSIVPHDRPPVRLPEITPKVPSYAAARNSRTKASGLVSAAGRLGYPWMLPPLELTERRWMIEDGSVA